jgi:hypothetical protein
MVNVFEPDISCGHLKKGDIRIMVERSYAPRTPYPQVHSFSPVSYTSVSPAKLASSDVPKASSIHLTSGSINSCSLSN